MKRMHSSQRVPMHLTPRQLSDVLGGEGTPMPAMRLDGQPMPGARRTDDGLPVPNDGTPLPA
jgi:hypothetical protein